MMRRWLKFNAAGIVGVFVQLGALHLLMTSFAVNYLAATAASVEVAVLHNFLWHERYTWRSRTRTAPGALPLRLLHFNLSNGAVSLAGNLLITKVLVGWFVPALVANLFAIAACSTINFLVAEYFVFGTKAPAEPAANDGGLFV